MPTYEYICKKCGHEFEVFQKITADPLDACPECRGTVVRLVGSGGGFILGGSSPEYGDDRVTTNCGRETPCCGRKTPCDERPCE